MTSEERRKRFAEIYDAYSGLILAYSAARTADAADAADVVAEVFTVAWRRIEDVPGGEEARPWLYGVARKVLANHHRGHRRRQQLDERVAAQVADVVGPTPANTEGPDWDAIARAFARLSASDRELLTLVGWEQLDRDEITHVLGVPRSTVRVRLHRARKRLETALENEGVKRVDARGHGPSRWATARPDPEEAR